MTCSTLRPRAAPRIGSRLRPPRAAAPLLLAALACRGEPTAPGAVRERWRQPQPGYSWARPAVLGDVVYFGTGDGQVIARDRATGMQRWAARVGGGMVKGANVVARAGVVAVAVVHWTVGLDAATGRELWRYDAPPDTGLGSPGLPGEVVLSRLDADDAAVYVPAWGASVSAVDLRTGAVRWAWQPGRAPTDTAASGRLFRSGSQGVRAVGDAVFAVVWHNLTDLGGRREAWLVALDRATGRERWRVTLPAESDGNVFGGPAVWGDLVLATAVNGATFAVRQATGEPVWQFASPDRIPSTPSQAEVYGDVVYLDGGDHYVYALRASDGVELWRSAFETQATADLLATERLVVFPEGSHLNVLDRATGRRLAHFVQPRVPDEEALFASPAAAASGEVFVTVNGGAWSFEVP